VDEADWGDQGEKQGEQTGDTRLLLD